jgi:aspartate racemase
MHIGLIGGIGPAATEFYYRGLIDRHARAGTELDVMIAHASVREMGANLAAGAAQAQAESFARLLRRLAAAGAELAAVTSMGGHFCIRELQAISPLPLLNAVPEVDAAIRARGLRTVGVMGTRTVMESGLYGGITSAQVVRPEGDALDAVHTAYITMAGEGRVTEAQRQVFFPAGRNRSVPGVCWGGLRVPDARLCRCSRRGAVPAVGCGSASIETLPVGEGRFEWLHQFADRAVETLEDGHLLGGRTSEWVAAAVQHAADAAFGECADISTGRGRDQPWHAEGVNDEECADAPRLAVAGLGSFADYGGDSAAGVRVSTDGDEALRDDHLPCGAQRGVTAANRAGGR